jgi:hypothetical protein
MEQSGLMLQDPGQEITPLEVQGQCMAFLSNIYRVRYAALRLDESKLRANL